MPTIGTIDGPLLSERRTAYIPAIAAGITILFALLNMLEGPPTKWTGTEWRALFILGTIFGAGGVYGFWDDFKA